MKKVLLLLHVQDGEPFGRSGLTGNNTIISNKGGFTETITDGIILNKLSANEIHKNIKDLIKDKKNLLKIQKIPLNFYFIINIFQKKLINIGLSYLIKLI